MAYNPYEVIDVPMTRRMLDAVTELTGGGWNDEIHNHLRNVQNPPQMRHVVITLVYDTNEVDMSEEQFKDYIAKQVFGGDGYRPWEISPLQTHVTDLVVHTQLVPNDTF